MSRSAKAAMTIAGRFCDTTSSDGTCGSGRPRGTGPTSATPRAPRSKSDRADQAADDEDERARDPRKREAKPEDDGQCDQADEQASPG